MTISSTEGTSSSSNMASTPATTSSANTDNTHSSADDVAAAANASTADFVSRQRSGMVAKGITTGARSTTSSDGQGYTAALKLQLEMEHLKYEMLRSEQEKKRLQHQIAVEQELRSASGSEASSTRRGKIPRVLQEETSCAKGEIRAVTEGIPSCTSQTPGQDGQVPKRATAKTDFLHLYSS